MFQSVLFIWSSECVQQNAKNSIQAAIYFGLKRFFFWTTVLVLFDTPLALAKQSTKYLFKVATLAPERSVWLNSYKGMADEVFDASGGLVKFKCYPGGIQGDELTVIRKMRIGQLQGAGLTGTGLSLLCKDSLVFQLPLMFNTEEEVDYVLPKLIPLLEAQCNKNGYEVLAWPRLGLATYLVDQRFGILIHCAKQNHVCWRTISLSKELFNQAKVSAIPAKIGDVLTGLRSGLINAVFAPPVGMVSLQWFTGVKNRLDKKILYSVGTIVVAKKSGISFPLVYNPKLRKSLPNTLENWIQPFVSRTRKHWRRWKAMEFICYLQQRMDKINLTD